MFPPASVKDKGRRASLALLIGLGAMTAATCAAAYLPGASTTAKNVVDNWTSTLTVAVAAGMCLYASQVVVDGRERLAWLVIALGFAATFVGESLWTYFELVAGIAVPFPSVGDVFYLAFYPLAFFGILLLVRVRVTRTERLTTLLDSLLFTLGVSGILWQVVIAPSISGDDELLTTVVALAYPIGDFLLVFATCSLFLTMEFRGIGRAAALLLGSFFVTVIADLGFAYLALNDDYASGSPVDPLWTIGYALAALAALSRVRETRAAEDLDSEATAALARPRAASISRMRLPRLVIPYLAFPAAVIIIATEIVESQADASIDDRAALITYAIALFALLMARQFMTLLENVRLSRSLHALSVDLEERVTARTKELAELNHAAAVLSRCLRTDDVLHEGLALLLSAAHAEQALVWLGQGRSRQLLLSHGIEHTSAKRLETLADEVPAFSEALSSCAVGALDLDSHPALRAALRRSDCGQVQVVVVPLVSRMSVVGTVALIMAPGRAGEAAQPQTLSALGSQLGVALENARQYEKARYQAERDAVTGLFNHRTLQKRLEEECLRARRSGGHFSLIMMDLDGFKLFNDTYGHPGGDEALRTVSSLLQTTLRESDIIGRYGGDEFMAILPDTRSKAAVKLCERVRGVLNERPFVTADGESIPLRMSFGVAAYPDDARRVNELIALADAALYGSKQRGGDRVTAGADQDEADVDMQGSMFGVLDSLVTAVDTKDKYTRHHSEDVTRLALLIAQQLLLSTESQKALRIAGLLHDVGKIGVPDRILRKPGHLTDEEMEIVRQHATLSEMIIKEIPNLHEVVEAAGSHHERWDGAGYPRASRALRYPCWAAFSPSRTPGQQ